MRINFLQPMLVIVVVAPAFGDPVFSERFDAALEPRWTVKNLSDPVGTRSWEHAPSDSPTMTPEGDKNYAMANFEVAGPSSSTATASTWLISQLITFDNGQHLSFDAISLNSEGFPDRLQVWLNVETTSTNVGDNAFSTGDFKKLLIDINPNYALAPEPEAFPTQWTTFSATLDGLPGPTEGRLAFRYFVEDSGLNGTRGTDVSIDDVLLEPASSPEPGTGCLLGGGLTVCLLRRRRKASR